MSMELYPELQKLKELVLVTSSGMINVVIIDGSIGAGKSTFARDMLLDLASNTNYNSIEFKDNNLLWLILVHYPKMLDQCHVTSDHFSIRVKKLFNPITDSNLAGAVIDLGDIEKTVGALDAMQLSIIKRFHTSKNTFYIFVLVNTKDQRDFFSTYLSPYPECVNINYLRLLDWEVRPEKYSGKFIRVQTGETPITYSMIPEELVPEYQHDCVKFCRDFLAL